MNNHTRACALLSSTALLLIALLSDPTPLPTPAAGTQDARPSFRVQELGLDANEGVAVADVNEDGQLDVIAGRNWYPAPSFTPHPLRNINDVDQYTHSNGDHVFDVNQNGRPDVVSQSFFEPNIYWYENPGEQGLSRGLLWNRHHLTAEGGSSNEASFLHDITGDGQAEFMVNSWDPDQPVLLFTFDHDAEGSPTLTRHEIGPGGHGHGMGFGDLTGNGRTDILVGSGWYEHPEGDPLTEEWSFHEAWDLPEASCPMLVTDVTGNGRSDIIWGNGHDYGLYWKEQLEPAEDGSLRFRQHLIDDSWSQAHALELADLTGDGDEDLITGKRKWGHNGDDPGADDPQDLYYYTWNDEGDFQRHRIASGIGTGLQIRTADLSDNGYLDIVVNGKQGAFIVFNEGPAAGTNR